jgi:hypothetical protein
VEHHVFAVTDGEAGGELWHIALDSAREFGDLDNQTGGRPPWGSQTVVDSACTVDTKGNLHVLVVTNEGELWSSVRAQGGDWTPVTLGVGGTSWVNVGSFLQGGIFKAVTAYTKNQDLHVLAATDIKKVWHIIRKPKDNEPIHKHGKWISPGGTEGKFEEVKFLGRAKGREFFTLAST